VPIYFVQKPVLWQVLALKEVIASRVKILQLALVYFTLMQPEHLYAMQSMILYVLLVSLLDVTNIWHQRPLQQLRQSLRFS
jgi:hypothetical protein